MCSGRIYVTNVLSCMGRVAYGLCSSSPAPKQCLCWPNARFYAVPHQTVNSFCLLVVINFSAKFDAVNDCLPLTISCPFFFFFSSPFHHHVAGFSQISLKHKFQVLFAPPLLLRSHSHSQTRTEAVWASSAGRRFSIFSLTTLFSSISFISMAFSAEGRCFLNRSMNTLLTRTSDTWVLSINVKNKTELSYRGCTLVRLSSSRCKFVVIVIIIITID